MLWPVDWLQGRLTLVTGISVRESHCLFTSITTARYKYFLQITDYSYLSCRGVFPTKTRLESLFIVMVYCMSFRHVSLLTFSLI